jgi:energy-coupling factor transporter ATP-binding protein EcfA2
MLMQIDEFRRRVVDDIDALVGELKFLTSRRTEAEESAWRSSLPKVAKAFSDPSFSRLHLFFGGSGSLALEYRLPGGNNWADLVLLGAHGGQASAVVVELKDWMTRGDLPGPGEGLMYRHSRNDQHPSRQVGGYVEACRNFHSVVQDRDAKVNGCVLFTKDNFYHTYKLPPNDQLFEAYPCFGLAPEDIKTRFPRFFSTLLTEPDEDFAAEFVRGTYRQSRSFVSLVGQQILDKESDAFVLLDGQRLAFDLVRARVREAVQRQTKQKRVILVIGPPGSGKSAVTARSWASLVTDPDTSDGNVVIATTSTSQHTNWQHIVEQASGRRAARNVIVKAGSFTPLATGEFGRLRKQYPTAFSGDADDWRANIAMARSLVGEFRSGTRDDEFLVTLVDEAHALINPEHSDGRGQFGFVGALGPQAYHIMRTSEVTVFLLDPRQGFRQHENTSLEDIRRWAEELGAEEPEIVSLEDCQFRCAGSKEYVDAIDALLSPAGPLPPAGGHDMPITFVDTPAGLDTALKPLVSAGDTCRLVASYAREWKTRDVALPRSLRPEQMDFHEPYIDGSERRHWSKIWNFAPDADYTLFVQAPLGSEMAGDPLAEVGCPYVVRNFDYDYIGLLWFSDLVWRTDRWVVNLEHVHETGISRIKGRAARNPASQDYADVLDAVTSAYRILLTRAIKGLFVWCEDEETRGYLQKRLSEASELS